MVWKSGVLLLFILVSCRVFPEQANYPFKVVEPLRFTEIAVTPPYLTPEDMHQEAKHKVFQLGCIEEPKGAKWKQASKDRLTAVLSDPRAQYTFADYRNENRFHLAEFYVGGESLNELLLAEGYAVVAEPRTPVACDFEKLLLVQNFAMSFRYGVWSEESSFDSYLNK